MSANIRRRMLSAAGAALLAWALSSPAQAQVDRDIVMNILRQCAKIHDPTARLACYDNNIRSIGGAAARSMPATGRVPQGGGTSVTPGTEGPGLDSVRPQQSASGRENAPAQQDAGTPTGQVGRGPLTVASAVERRPGAYLVTLEGGAQWEFVEDVALNYRPPRQGSTVEIERGTFGSYLLRFDHQQPVRVRRVR